MSHQFKVAGVFSAMEVAASGLTAERGRMNVIASNLANARTTKGADGQAYHRLDPVFSSHSVNENSFDPVLRNVSEVSMDGVKPDQSPGNWFTTPVIRMRTRRVTSEYPNVNVVTEMVNLMTASRAYGGGRHFDRVDQEHGESRAEDRHMIIHGISNSDVARVQPSDAGIETTKQDGVASGDGVSFGDVLTKTVTNASTDDHVASQKVDALAAGVSDDLHGTMISVKEAEISMKLVGSIRNKLIDAFQELWRTSV